MLAKGLEVLVGHNMWVKRVVIDGESNWHINSLMAPRSSFVHSMRPGQQCLFIPFVFIFSLSLHRWWNNQGKGWRILGTCGWGVAMVEKVEITKLSGACWRGYGWGTENRLCCCWNVTALSLPFCPSLEDHSDREYMFHILFVTTGCFRIKCTYFS